MHLKLNSVLALLFLVVIGVCAAQSTAESSKNKMIVIGVDELRWCIGFALICSLVALIFALFFAASVVSKNPGTPKMIEIADAIAEGASAFLAREYFALLFFVVPASIVVILVNINAGWWQTGIAFYCGSGLSALCGFVGMKIATKSNVRTASAAMDFGMSAALRVAFNSGSVMGLSVVGFGLLGVSALLLLFSIAETSLPANGDKMMALEYISGFAFGASSIALFARVAGGIYTKAADVGSDLVGKVEAGIPEDDPRNPGVIADNVGDNVGDVAGMGADLFESFVGSIISAALLGDTLRFNGSLERMDYQGVALPFVVAGCGIIASLIGGLSVRCPEGATQIRLLWAMRVGVIVSSVFVVGFTAIANWGILNIRSEYTIAVYVGLLAGVLIGWFTEYATAFEYQPVRTIAFSGVTGPATVIIQGLGVGQLSTLPPVLILCITICLCLILGDVYAVSIAAVGMLSTLGMTLSTDAYGPVADNAGGIAEMAELPKEVREKTDALDALGNTTAATGKGFAIGSAVLTALALLSAYADRVGLKTVDLITGDDSKINFVVPGILFGTMLPFLFSALTMLAVGKSATSIIVEVRRQFREIPGLLEGKPGAKADYAKCVAISTSAAIREMVLPGFIAVIVPVIVGLGFGAQALAGLLIGSIASGFLLAVMMANAGGAWDNAKKWVESGAAGLGGKGTSIHAATVTGDTVGDPFKDTSGPSLNILIKLSAVISLVLAPAFQADSQKKYWWVSLIVFFVSAVAVVIWINYVKSKDIPLEIPTHATVKGGVSAHGSSGRRHRSRGRGGQMQQQLV